MKLWIHLGIWSEFLGGLSARCNAFIYTGHHNLHKKIRTIIHASRGIRTHNPNVWEEKIGHRRQGHRDWCVIISWMFSTYIPLTPYKYFNDKMVNKQRNIILIDYTSALSFTGVSSNLTREVFLRQLNLVWVWKRPLCEPIRNVPFSGKIHVIIGLP
jgi:hypothetical protein